MHPREKKSFGSPLSPRNRNSRSVSNRRSQMTVLEMRQRSSADVWQALPFFGLAFICGCPGFYSFYIIVRTYLGHR